jgi:hypothetical protein
MPALPQYPEQPSSIPVITDHHQLKQRSSLSGTKPIPWLFRQPSTPAIASKAAMLEHDLWPKSTFHGTSIGGYRREKTPPG